MNEHDYEPVKGLPETPPSGEELLWQGAPRWQTLARRAFHVDKVAAYFALLIGIQLALGLADGLPAAVAAKHSAWLALLGAAAVGVLALLAWSFARTTVYSITSQRLVMRFGVAIPITINLPFSRIAAAALKTHRDGSGNLPLRLVDGEKVSYWVLWPHARPWHFAPAQPMLRAVPRAAEVAALLAESLQAAPAGRGGEAGDREDPEDAGRMAAA